MSIARILSDSSFCLSLFPGIKLYRCHTDRDSDDFKKIVGEVIRNPKNPAIWGLRNLSDEVWQVETKDGNVKNIGKNEVLVVTKAKQIHFPNCIGTIE